MSRPVPRLLLIAWIALILASGPMSGADAPSSSGAATTPANTRSAGAGTLEINRPTGTTTNPTARGGVRISVPKIKSPSIFTRIRYQAGGWGLLYPALELGTRAIEAIQMKDADLSTRLEYVTRTVRTKEFWGGLAGDMILTAIFEGLTAAMPGSAFIKSFVVCAAGFAGFELGSGNIKNTDWGELLFQSAVLTAVYCGVASLAIPHAAVFATLASFAAGLILDHLNGPEKITDEDDSRETSSSTVAAPEVTGPQQASTSEPVDEQAPAAQLQAEYRASYLDLMEKVRVNGSGPVVDQAHRRFQRAQQALRDRKIPASATR